MKKYELIMFTFNQWIGIHGAICTMLVFANEEKEKEAFKKIMVDIENMLIREKIIEQSDLEPMRKILASKRKTRRCRKWLIKS